MTEMGWKKRVHGLRQQLTLIKSRAHKDSARFQELWRQIEYCKVLFLAHQLEARRKFLVRSRGGVVSLAERKKSLPLLGIATGIAVLAGMITKDGTVAVNAGVASSDGVLRALGETEWVVCLGQNLVVAPRDSDRQGKIWVTWKSLMVALDELAIRTKDESLGNLENIIAELLKNENIVFLPPPSTGWATV